MHYWMRHVHDEDIYEAAVYGMDDLLTLIRSGPEGVEYAKMTLSYAFGAGRTQNWEALKEMHSYKISEGQHAGMTVAEMFKADGVKEGLEQGLKQGEFSTKISLVKNLFRRGMKLEDIAEVTALSLEECEQAIVSMDAILEVADQ